MGFLDRAINGFSTVAALNFIHSTWAAEAVYLEQKMGANFTSIGVIFTLFLTGKLSFQDLVSKCSFMFTNANPYLNYPRPLIHKTVEIGGITIDVKEPGPLGEVRGLPYTVSLVRNNQNPHFPSVPG